MLNYETGSNDPIFNVDRWANYSMQRWITNGVPNPLNKLASENWVQMTPAQMRRCKKKARKNLDDSIGLGTTAKFWA
jgi:hypothetical protein